MVLDSGLFYLYLLELPNRKGIYNQKDAVEVFNACGRRFVLFPSFDMTHAVLVKYVYGKYSAVEL